MLHRHLAHLPTVQLLHFDALKVPNALNATLSCQIFRQRFVIENLQHLGIRVVVYPLSFGDVFFQL